MELNETITDRRRQTRSNIYHYLYRHRDFCSKQTLAQDMKLSLPTVYQNLTELIDAGLVNYTGEQRSTGGRRAMGLDIVPDARIAIGVSVTDDRIRLVAADLRLQELCYRRVMHPLDDDFCRFAPFLSEELEKFLNDNHIDRQRLLGVGIAFPGVISADRQSMVSAPTLHMRNMTFKSLQQAIPYPIWVQNDGTCGGHAEGFMRSMRHEVKDSGNLGYLSLENGVGGALLIDGQLYDGNHFRSGEFGHMRVENNGLACECGRHGCLEAYCSAKRISDDLGLTLDEFFRRVNIGDPEYVDLWQDILQHLAVGINSINMVLDCDVVLGGFLGEYLEPWLPQLRQYVAQGNPFEENGDFVHLSLLKSHNAPLGAALHFIQQFIDSI